MAPRAIRGVPRDAHNAGLSFSADRGSCGPHERVYSGSGETGRRGGKSGKEIRLSFLRADGGSRPPIHFISIVSQLLALIVGWLPAPGTSRVPDNLSEHQNGVNTKAAAFSGK